MDSLLEKNAMDWDSWKEHVDDMAVLNYYPLFLAKENYDEIAKVFWESHMRVRTRQASSSGLIVEERAAAPTVRGQFWQTEVLYMTLRDVFGIPIKCPWYYDEEIVWE